MPAIANGSPDFITKRYGVFFLVLGSVCHSLKPSVITRQWRLWKADLNMGFTSPCSYRIVLRPYRARQSVLRDEAPFGKHDGRGTLVGRDDREELRGRRVIRRLKFLRTGDELRVEVILDGALVDGDAVAPAHMRCTVSQGPLSSPLIARPRDGSRGHPH